MNTTVFSLLGQPLTVATIVAIVAALQFVVIALWSGYSKAKFAKTGSRPSEIALMVSACVMLGAWAWIFDAPAAIRAATSSGAVQASATGNAGARGSCASIETGMKASAVRGKVGEPDQIVNVSEVRGNGAEMWVYADRCNVQMFEGKVELVE